MINCEYCKTPAVLRSGKQLGVHWERNKWMYWACLTCGAKVGCHPRTTKPLGTLANKDLSILRYKAHEQFDKLWLDRKLARTLAYVWLTDKLGINRDDCHIGKFDEEQCKKVIEVSDHFELMHLL